MYTYIYIYSCVYVYDMRERVRERPGSSAAWTMVHSKYVAAPPRPAKGVPDYRGTSLMRNDPPQGHRRFSLGPIPTLTVPHPAPCTLHPTPCTLHPTTKTLHPTPCTLHPTSCTPHPTPYTLHLTTCILHPTPYFSLLLYQSRYRS